MPATQEQVLDALRTVNDPDLHRDIVALGFVTDLRIQGDRAAFKIELTTPACPVKDLLEEQARAAVLAIEGIREVEIEMSARVRERQTAREDLLPNVRQIVAVASGKGGVGKSTVSVNLAVALARQGAKVGLLDADVYGPSVPMMMGVRDERPLAQNQKIVPIERYGVRMMSLGFLLEEGQAVLWRGPMVHSTLKQLLGDVLWGELDYLLVDLPPGTGDAPMTLGQLVPLSGVVIVTTPHNVAANIAGKAATLFRRLDATLLGVVENMATFVCPTCGSQTRVFAGSSGEELARELEVPYLGTVPLDPTVSEAAERGEPSVLAYPDGIQAKAFNEIAGRLAAQLSIRSQAASEAKGRAGLQPVEG
jgi:ATP-binding protein involved in chromosome partitioning